MNTVDTVLVDFMKLTSYIACVIINLRQSCNQTFAGELRDAMRVALDNKEGNQYCDDLEYEFDVDADISCIFEPVGA